MSAAGQIKAAELMPPKLDAGSKTVRMQLVLPTSLLDVIEEWRAKQRPVPNVSEAIRRMIVIAAQSEVKPPKPD